MSDNVVSIRGNDGYVVQREPDGDTIRECRRLLALAETGEIVGVAGAVMYWDKGAGPIAGGWKCLAQIGELYRVANFLARQFD